MATTHRVTIRRRCPVDDALDVYQATFFTSTFIQVEDILAAIAALPEKAFQEVITRELAIKLGCRVVTVGYHSGVQTTCQEG